MILILTPLQNMYVLQNAAAALCVTKRGATGNADGGRSLKLLKIGNGTLMYYEDTLMLMRMTR